MPKSHLIELAVRLGLNKSATIELSQSDKYQKNEECYAQWIICE